MTDAPDASAPTPANDEDYEDVEDPDSVEGAVYPLQGESGDQHEAQLRGMARAFAQQEDELTRGL